MQISVSTPLYPSLCVTCRSVYLNPDILHSVLHVDQCIYTLLFFTLCYMQINVSTPFYYSLCVTCRSVYLHHSMLQSVLHVDQCICPFIYFTLLHLDQCIYTILLFPLCYMYILSTPFYTVICYTGSVYHHNSMLTSPCDTCILV